MILYSIDSLDYWLPEFSNVGLDFDRKHVYFVQQTIWSKWAVRDRTYVQRVVSSSVARESDPGSLQHCLSVRMRCLSFLYLCYRYSHRMKRGSHSWPLMHERMAFNQCATPAPSIEMSAQIKIPNPLEETARGPRWSTLDSRSSPTGTSFILDNYSEALSNFRWA